MSPRHAAPSWRPPVLLAVAVLLVLGLSAGVLLLVPDAQRFVRGVAAPGPTAPAPEGASGAVTSAAPTGPGGDDSGTGSGIVVEGERSPEDVHPAVAVAVAPTPSPTAEGDEGRGAEDGDKDAAGSTGVDGSASDDASAAAARVLVLVNAERAEAGCSPLRQDPALDALATAHSQDMRARDYFDHTDPDGLTPWDRADAAGVRGLAAENIALGQPDADAVVEAWMNSPGHRANILECSHTRHGLGMVAGAGGPWWTQVFGR